jgi:hypothetical protein
MGQAAAAQSLRVHKHAPGNAPDARTPPSHEGWHTNPITGKASTAQA